jgi:hypothetical protein
VAMSRGAPSRVQDLRYIRGRQHSGSRAAVQCVARVDAPKRNGHCSSASLKTEVPVALIGEAGELEVT